jgi:hypothetical protein
MHDPSATRWIREEGGVDNAPAPAGVQGQYFAGIARAALVAYADGDTVVPTFDIAGRLMVNMGGIAVVPDNDAVVAGVDQESVLNLNYGYDPTGANWRRLNVCPPGTSPVDERLMALRTSAFLRAINPLAAAGSRGVILNAGAASTVQDETLMRLLCRCALAGLDYSAAALSQSVAIAARNVGVTPVDERYPGLYGLAFVRGINSGAAAGSQGVAVEARDGTAATSFLKALIGLTTNSRMAAYRLNSNDWYGISGDIVSQVSGTLATAPLASYANAIAVGIDNTAAAVLRPVEVEGATSVSASAREAWYSLATHPARGSGWAAAKRGGRFQTTNSTVGLAVTGQLAYVATTPTLMLRINSALIRAIPRSLSISLANVPGGVVTVYAALDTSDRYSAAGTAVTPSNTNEESATAAVALFYENPTAAAAGATTRPLGHWTIPPSLGSILDLDFEDSDLLGITAATLLIYIYAPVTAPQVFYHFDHEEVR